MRYLFQSLLYIAAGVGALWVLMAASDMRSAIQEIELEIGVLIAAVAIGALYIGAPKPVQQQSGQTPPYPPPPEHQ